MDERNEMPGLIRHGNGSSLRHPASVDPYFHQHDREPIRRRRRQRARAAYDAPPITGHAEARRFGIGAVMHEHKDRRG